MTRKRTLKSAIPVGTSGLRSSTMKMASISMVSGRNYLRAIRPWEKGGLRFGARKVTIGREKASITRGIFVMKVIRLTLWYWLRVVMN